MNNLHWIDICVIGIYLILCLVIGLYKSGKIKTIREYTLGSGRISTTVLFFTIFATHVGAGATIGVVEKIHSMGLILAVSIMFEPLFWFITAKVFAGNINTFKKAGCMSVSDIMGFLYGKQGKWAANILSILFGMSLIGTQVLAIGYLFNYFLGLSHFIGILIGFGVLVVYSLFGGIRAVAFTDTFQGLVLLVAIPIACTIALHEVGGYGLILEALPETHLSIDFTWDNMLLLASMLACNIVPMSQGAFMQRFLMANNSKQLTKTLVNVGFVCVPFIMVICLIGFVMKVQAPDVDPNNAFFYLINNYLPVGITGLLISGVLATIMSTADSWLNTTSVVCAHDIAKTLFPNLSDKQELLIARLSVVIVAFFSLTLALSATSLMELAWFAVNFWEPIIFIPIASGFMKFQTNSKSFVSSAILGIIGVLSGKYLTGDFATVSMFFGMIGSAMGLFGMHYWQVATNQDVSNTRLAQYSDYEAVTPRKRFNIFKTFQTVIKEQSTRHKKYCYLLGCLGMVYFLGSSFFMEFTEARVLRTIVYMKGMAAILCFGLCIYEFHLTPRQQKVYMPIYWNLVLLYCFPFLSTYIALVYEGSMPWMINLMLSTILLYVFGGWMTMIGLSLMGGAAAYMLFKLTGYTLAVSPSSQPQMLGYVYCLLTGAIVLVLKQKDMLQEKAVETKMLYGAAVAHEVVNPLQSSAMMADTLLNAFEGKRFEDIKKEEF
ncbi:MAG: sodium:solute symporter, partial [Alphaproteobacteria bacterium]